VSSSSYRNCFETNGNYSVQDQGKRLFLRTKQYWKTGNPAIANKLIVKIVTTIREFDESIKRGPRLSASETATILENIAWSIREEAEK